MKKLNNNLKVILGTVAGFMLGGITMVSANQAIQAIQNNQIKISLDGNIQTFKDETTGEIQYPITYNNRTYLPLRNVAQLAGLDVDYNSLRNEAILSSKSINQVNTDYELDFIRETTEEVNKKIKKVKDSLVGNGQYVLKSAYNKYSKDDFFEYWGTGARYGGGIIFYDNDEFGYAIGITESGNNLYNSGKYLIDIYQNKIIYIFNNGLILEGEYKIENGEVVEVNYIEYREDESVYVTLMKKPNDYPLNSSTIFKYKISELNEIKGKTEEYNGMTLKPLKKLEFSYNNKKHSFAIGIVNDNSELGYIKCNETNNIEFGYLSTDKSIEDYEIKIYDFNKIDEEVQLTVDWVQPGMQNEYYYDNKVLYTLDDTKFNYLSNLPICNFVSSDGKLCRYIDWLEEEVIERNYDVKNGKMNIIHNIFDSNKTYTVVSGAKYDKIFKSGAWVMFDEKGESLGGNILNPGERIKIIEIFNEVAFRIQRENGEIVTFGNFAGLL